MATCAADHCKNPKIPSGQRYYWHVRLGVAIHPNCYRTDTVKGEDVSMHAVMPQVAK